MKNLNRHKVVIVCRLYKPPLKKLASPLRPPSFLSWDLFTRCTYIPFASLAPSHALPSMAPLTKCFVLLALALFASALATPHISRNVHNHRGLIHPKGAVEARIPIPAALRRKRSLGRRCESQPSNVTDPTPSPSPPAPVNVAANPAPQSPSPAPQEPAPAPPSLSSSSTPTPTPTPSSSSPAAPAATSPTSSSGGGSYPSYMTGTQGGQGRQLFFFAWLSLISSSRHVLQHRSWRLWHNQQRWPTHRCRLSSPV